MDKFDSILSSVIDSHLGLRSTLIGYQYSEIIRAVFSLFCCGDPRSICRHGTAWHTTENISYTEEKTGNVYDFNTAEKQNHLLIKLLLATGLLTEGGEYNVDFDHQFLTGLIVLLQT